MAQPTKLDTLTHVLRERDGKWSRWHRKVPAAIERVEGGVSAAGVDVGAEVVAIARLRWIDDLAASDRLEVDGEQLSIVRILKHTENEDQVERQWAEIHCEEVTE